MKFIRTLFNILVLLVLAVVALPFVYAFILSLLDDSDSEKQWCMEVIAEYERDSSSIEFNELGTASAKILKRDPETGLYGGPTFWLYEDGSYRCVVPVSGGLFPKQHEYTNERNEWEFVD